MTELFGWASTLVSIAASLLLSMAWLPVLSIYKIWLVSNLFGLYYGIRLREKPILLLNVVYLILNVIGLIRWHA